MNGQGPNQQGFNPNVGVPQHRPKFNFNNREVKKEITPDFMAAQLASFGSSAKLKSLPAQSPAQTNTFPQQSYPAAPGFQQMPMGFQQYNPAQGFRQPMMAPMPFQNQNMNPSMNMPSQGMYSSPGNMAMQMPRGNVMNTPRFPQFNMQVNMQPNIQTNMGMQQNRFPSQVPISAIPSTGNAMPIMPSFQPSPSSSSQLSSGGNMFDIFNKPSTATQSGKASSTGNDPFFNLRGSTQPMASQSSSRSRNSSSTTSAFPVQNLKSNSNQATFEDAFGSRPFTQVSTPPAQQTSQTGLMNFGNSFNPQMPSSNSLITAQSNSKQFSTPLQSTTPSPALSDPTFPGIGSAFSASVSSSNPIAPDPTLFPPSSGVSLSFGNDFHPSTSKPVEHNMDLFNKGLKSEPRNDNLFGQVPFVIESKKADSFAIAGAFTRKDSQLDIFGPPLATKADPFNNVEATVSTDTFGQTKNVTPPKPLSVDLFDSPPFSTGASKPTPKFPSVADNSDKYSVFSSLQSSETSQAEPINFAPFKSEPVYSSVAKPTPPAPFHAEVPVSFPADALFGDAFDPFGASKPNTLEADPFGASKPRAHEAGAFDVFDQLSNRADTKGSTSQSSSGTVRERPSAKTPSTMILLPPPTKGIERTRTGPPSLPPRHDELAFGPFSNQGGLSATKNDNFDPFGVETDGAQLSTTKSSTSLPPPKPAPAYSGSKPAPRPPRPSSKRPAPPPPTRKEGPPRSTFYSDEKRDVPSLLDLDFSLPAAPPPAKQAQPLLILPSYDAKKSAPPARPPPPKIGAEEEGPARSVFEGMPPPLPPRPGPGHKLYHYMLSTGPHALALFDFEAENADELDFKVGDTIELTADVSDDWYSGCVGTKSGIFPKNLVDVKIKLATDGSSIVAPVPASWAPVPQSEPAGPVDPFNAWGDTAPPSPPASPVSSMPELAPTKTTSVFDTNISSVFDTNISSSVFDTPATKSVFTTPAAPITAYTARETAVAVHTFEAQEEDELDVREGDTIEIIEYLEGEWLRGKIGDRTGIIPKSYVSFGDEDITEDVEEILDDTTHSVNVFYDFQSDAADELNLKAGDMVTVLGIVGQEWLRGKCNGSEGIFPTCFVPIIPAHWNIPHDSETFTESFETTEETSDSSSDNETSDAMSLVSEGSTHDAELGRVQAVADFEAENDFEMSLKKDDIVTVTAKLNETWLEGSCNGNAGIFPITFVKWLDAGHESEPSFLSNPLVSDDMPAMLRQETLTTLERQETLTVLVPDPDLTPRKQTEETPRSDPDSLLSPTFSMSNPFAGDSGPFTGDSGPFTGDNSSPFPRDVTPFSGDSGPFTPQPGASSLPGEEELNKTLVSPENPFTETFSTDNSESPFSAVSPVGDVGPAPGDKMSALYAFLPDNEDELAFEEGDEIVITEYINEEWLKGECRGKEGLFPTSYATRK